MFSFFRRKKETIISRYPQKVDLSDQLKGFYGQHRSGWPYVLRLLSSLHNPHGIKLDTFIERTFCWHPDGIKPNLRPWIGFIHVPPNVPQWFQSEQSNDFIFQTPAWGQSFPYCKGLFTLSKYHRQSLETKLNIPIENLIFPTETPQIKWDWNKFVSNPQKQIIQIGWWLRKLHTIYQLPVKSYSKVFLKITHADIDALMKKEKEILIEKGEFTPDMYKTAQTLVFLPDDEYDKLISQNIVIIELYDSSANNTVIECIVRNTPLLVNPIPSVVEYLGQDYPLYFSSLEEAAEKAEDLELIRQTHQYLIDHPIKKRLDGDYFLESFVNSSIYRGL